MSLFLHNVLNDKTPPRCEILIHLFEHCNLKCSFCMQDHDTTLYMDETSIDIKANQTIQYIKSNPSLIFDIHIMGGELFQDTLIEAGYLDLYSKFIAKIRDALPNKELVIGFTTNLIFDNTTSIRKFVETNKIHLLTSYDFKGRFNKKNYKVFKSNIYELHDIIDVCSMVSTKPNINTFISKSDELYDFIYDYTRTTWDTYLPSDDNPLDGVLMPSDADMLKLNKYLIEHYPKTMSIDSYLNKDSYNKMSCSRSNTLVILVDGPVDTTKGCVGTAYNKEDLGDTGVDTYMTETFNCLECKYYNRCPLTCFVSYNSDKMTKELPIGTCINYESFEFADRYYN